jgi:hypothetical protein
MNFYRFIAKVHQFNTDTTNLDTQITIALHIIIDIIVQQIKSTSVYEKNNIYLLGVDNFFIY